MMEWTTGAGELFEALEDGRPVLRLALLSADLVLELDDVRELADALLAFIDVADEHELVRHPLT